MRSLNHVISFKDTNDSGVPSKSRVQGFLTLYRLNLDDPYFLQGTSKDGKTFRFRQDLDDFDVSNSTLASGLNSSTAANDNSAKNKLLEILGGTKTTPGVAILESVLDNLYSKNDPLYWANCVTNDYRGTPATEEPKAADAIPGDFANALEVYRKLILNTLTNTINATDTSKNNFRNFFLQTDISEAQIQITNFRRTLNIFENTITITFDALTLRNLLKKANFQTMDSSGEPIPDLKLFRENDMIAFHIKRDTGVEERPFLGFITNISTSTTEGQLQKVISITCYGMYKLLGMNQAISEPAIYNQFEQGEDISLYLPSFTPFENVFAGLSIQDIYTYIMTNVLALDLQTSIDTTLLSGDDAKAAVSLKTAEDKKEEDRRQIDLNQKSQNKLLQTNKTDLPVNFQQYIITAINNSQAPKIKQDTDVYFQKLADAQKIQDSNKQALVTNQDDMDNQLKMAQDNQFHVKEDTTIVAGTTTKGSPIILNDLTSFDIFKTNYLKLNPGQSAVFNALDNSWFNRFKPLMLKYLDLESQIRNLQVDQVIQLQTIAGTKNKKILSLLKFNYYINPNSENFTTSNFRLLFQLLFLKYLIDSSANKPVATLSGVSQFFAYNRTWKTAWKDYYAQLDYPVKPLEQIREKAFYDLFEDETNTLVCRVPKYNKFDYSNLEEFVITSDQVIGPQTESRDDVKIETRVDYSWYFPFVNDLPFHFGHYTDMGTLTKYGMRAQSPRSNPNVSVIQMGTLFAALEWAKVNGGTRPATLRVVNDREYHLGQLYYYVPDLTYDDIFTGADKGISGTTGYVGYLVDYVSEFAEGGVPAHTLTFEFVRKAQGVELNSPLTVGVTTKNDNIVEMSLSEILNFRKLPDLDSTIRIVENNEALSENTSKNVIKQTVEQNLAKAGVPLAEVRGNFYITGVNNPNIFTIWGNNQGVSDVNTFWSTATPVTLLSATSSKVVTPFQTQNFGGNTSQNLVDLLYCFDTRLKQLLRKTGIPHPFGPISNPSPIIDFLDTNHASVNVFPRGTTVTIPAGTAITIHNGTSLDTIPLLAPPDIDVIVAVDTIFLIPQTVEKNGIGPDNLGPPLVNGSFRVTTTRYDLTNSSDPLEIIAQDGHTYLTKSFSITSSPIITKYKLPFIFSLESLIDSGSIIAGTYDSKTLSEEGSAGITPNLNLHFYGSAIDFSLLPWATQGGGYIQPTPLFTNDLVTILNEVFGITHVNPTSSDVHSDTVGWIQNSIISGSSTFTYTTTPDGNQVPISNASGTNPLAFRWHVQVPGNILFPVGSLTGNLHK